MAGFSSMTIVDRVTLDLVAPSPTRAGVVRTLALVAITVVLAIWMSLGPANAGDQVKLTDDMIKRFIAMQTELVAMAKDLEDAEDPDDKLKAQLKALATKHGFASIGEFDAVATSITLIMTGIDPDTGVWADPKIGIRGDMEDVKKDTTIDDAERRELLKDLNEALESTPDIAHKSNIPVVKKFAAEIEKLLE
ncbi:MAG: hypothetical protein AAFQ11_11525 [Pseudomonadota bacterium]